MADLGDRSQLRSHPLERVAAGDFEWSAEVERLLLGPTDWALRVRYRPRSSRGTSNRRWVRFILVPAVGATFEETSVSVEPAIVEHFRREAGVA